MTIKPTILVVDDEVDVRVGVSKVLVRAGYTVLTAGDGEEALDTLYDLGPADLIVLDLMMPKLDGYQVMVRLRETPFKHVPVLLLTAKSAPRDIGLGYSKGADLYLTKPFDPQVLLKAVSYLTCAEGEERTELEAFLLEQDEVFLVVKESQEA